MSIKEDNIKILCNSVLDMSLCFYDNPNGPYEYTCPMCGNKKNVYGNEIIPSISTIIHSENCGYLIAKDLLERLK